jgi:hypothetical protein
MRFSVYGKGVALAAANLLQMAAADNFEWGVIGDSWTSGVAYSVATVYKLTDLEYCYRTNETWGAQMEADTTWTIEPQNFHFAGCGGTLMNDLKRQMGLVGNSQLILGTMGGNNAHFGDIARACIYQPPGAPSGGWGLPYDQDPNGEGLCKQNLALSRTYLTDPTTNNLHDDFTTALNDVFSVKLTGPRNGDRFDLYVSSYVEFFDATTDACDDWTFSRWFSVGHPKLVKALRAEINELVDMFNGVQADVISKYPKPADHDYNVQYIPVSDEFQNHRFCEANHNFEDQFSSSDVWLYNLAYKNGDLGGTDQPPDAPNGPLPILSLDTLNRSYLDNELFDTSLVNAQSQSGFGWTARPFHPKPFGYEAMKNFFIQRLKDDGIPGVVPNSGTPSAPPPPVSITSAPGPTPSVYCTNPSLEDGDGLCTCNVGTFIFTTFTPVGGPGNSCGESTIVPPQSPQRRRVYTTMTA